MPHLIKYRWAIKFLLTGFKGAQGQHSNNGDDSHYSPAPPQGLPHPVLVNFYMSYYEQAYRSTLDNQSAYQNIFQAAYADAQKNAYNRELPKPHLADQQRGYNQAYAGFIAGVADGSYKKGYDLSYNDSTFGAALQIDIAKYRAVGKQQADDFYHNNAVIEITSLNVIDSDNDGINRPGETLQSVLIVKNYGLLAKLTCL